MLSGEPADDGDGSPLACEALAQLASLIVEVEYRTS